MLDEGIAREIINRIQKLRKKVSVSMPVQERTVGSVQLSRNIVEDKGGWFKNPSYDHITDVATKIFWNVCCNGL